MTNSDDEKTLKEVHQRREEYYALQNLGLDGAESFSFWGCFDEYLDSLLFIRQHDHTPEGVADTTSSDESAPYILEKGKVDAIISALKNHLRSIGENVEYFGVERNGGVEKVIGNIYQGSDEGDYYPSVESKAAHLLYFLVKDHLFVDGNKRIAAFLFIWFLDVNGMLHRGIGEPVIPYGIIYKLTVFVADSNPKDKDVIVDLIIHIISFHKELLLDLPTI